MAVAAEAVLAVTVSVAGNVVAVTVAVKAVTFAVAAGLQLGMGKEHMTVEILQAGAPGHPRYSSLTLSPCGQHQLQHTSEQLDILADLGGPDQPDQEDSLSLAMLHMEMHSYLAWGGS